MMIGLFSNHLLSFSLFGVNLHVLNIPSNKRYISHFFVENPERGEAVLDFAFLDLGPDGHLVHRAPAGETLLEDFVVGNEALAGAEDFVSNHLVVTGERVGINHHANPLFHGLALGVLEGLNPCTSRVITIDRRRSGGLDFAGVQRSSGNTNEQSGKQNFPAHGQFSGKDYSSVSGCTGWVPASVCIGVTA